MVDEEIKLEEITHFIFTDVVEGEYMFDREAFLDKAKEKIAELKDVEEAIEKVENEKNEKGLRRFKPSKIQSFSFISGLTPEKSWYWGWGIIIAKKAKGVKQEKKKI